MSSKEENAAKVAAERAGAAKQEYIAGINKVEIRNIMDLDYVDNLNWVQVAHRMNDLYKDH